MRPPCWVSAVAAVALLCVLAPGEGRAQVGSPMPGGDLAVRSYHDEFAGLLYGSDSGWATIYPTTRAGEVLDLRLAGLRIASLPDSLHVVPGTAIPVLVRRDWYQRGATTPRLIATTLRYASDVSFERFLATVMVETANAPDGDIALFVDGERIGTYSNRARYSSAAALFWMERPFALMRVMLGERVLWEGIFVTVAERRSRMRFVAGGIEIVSP